MGTCSSGPGLLSGAANGLVGWLEFVSLLMSMIKCEVVLGAETVSRVREESAEIQS